MATIAAEAVTLMDVARRTDPNGNIADVVEVLAETNEVLQDMLWVEGNLPTGHLTTVRTGLPNATWRMLNYGTPVSKSTTKQVTDTAGMLETWSQIDKDLAELNGNSAKWRLSEETPFLEALNQEFSSTLWYGDTNANPEKFVGFAPRYNDPSAGNGVNVLNGGGSGDDNSSIYLIVWGANTVHGIYPKGSKAGILQEDLGLQTVLDGDGNPYRAFQTHWQWKGGLTVRDWRYVVRICNIDISNLGGSSAANLIDFMSEATEMIPNLGMGKPVFYMNRKLRTALRKQIRDKNNVNLTLDSVAGKTVLGFDGIPVRRSDALILAESAISFE